MILGEGEGISRDGAIPFIMHRSETIVSAQADPFPKPVFDRDEVSEVFAHQREAGERRDVGKRGALEDIDQELRWDCRNGAGERGGAFRRGRGRNGEG